MLLKVLASFCAYPRKLGAEVYRTYILYSSHFRVPHGTVLGPLLFLLYINDITADIKSDIRLFADDCILYLTISSRHDQTILQEDINTLHSRTKTWQMQFNSKKVLHHVHYQTTLQIR